ncbi:nucleotidyltransferase [Serratia marcescens]|uniref:nucleotidyltransferase n=1 Tax=Serratia marcescens TaxID=615 RepID=UPI002176F767|nr:nucleotidyltransferase [Serratia marcescens]CAI0998201.1 Uncharacterised protein [Serratia marcescens]
MATTVTSAFNQFMKDTVNLSKDRTDKARGSRDWLLERITSLPQKDAKFPTLYSNADIHFGSFSRRTKIRPLDDIDLMIGLDGDGCTYSVENDRIVINTNESTEKLNGYTHNYPNNNLLNSRKIIEIFKSGLKNISQYEDADINRNQEATTLKLSSYEWNFDIVPCFITRKDSLENNFYLIPDGNGHWKKTDPRIDKKRTTDINVRLDGNVLNVIRVTKYWQKRSTMPTMSSYLLETILLNYYSTRNDCSSYVDLELEGIFNHLSNVVYNKVNDTKGFIDDLNNLTQDERDKISKKALADRDRVQEARGLEFIDPEKAIRIWRDIFGNDFPTYGDK